MVTPQPCGTDIVCGGQLSAAANVERADVVCSGHIQGNRWPWQSTRVHRTTPNGFNFTTVEPLISPPRHDVNVPHWCQTLLGHGPGHSHAAAFIVSSWVVDTQSSLGMPGTGQLRWMGPPGISDPVHSHPATSDDALTLGHTLVVQPKELAKGRWPRDHRRIPYSGRVRTIRQQGR